MTGAGRVGFRLAASALLALGLAGVAQAQVNPFGRGPNAPRLTAEDTRMQGDAARTLLDDPAANPGTAQSWSNAKSGNSGAVTLQRSFTTASQPCRALRYHIKTVKPAASRNLTVNWCKVTDGSWKIHS